MRPNGGHPDMVALLHSHRIAYFPVPKIANTSIKAAFYRIEEGRDWLPDPEASRELGRRYRTKPMSPIERRRAAGHWKFAVVRDPVERLLSAYQNRVVELRDVARSSQSVTLARLFRVSVEPDIDEFIARLSTYRLISDRIRRHTNSQRHYLGRDLGYFDRVFRIGELDVLAGELSDRTGLAVELPRHQRSQSTLLFADLAPATKQKALAHLREDYELLRGLYETPVS